MTKRNGNGKAAPKFKRDPRNARKHGDRNKSLIRESLEAVGPLRSIGVDGDNIIRAGNGVFEQAEALGLKVKVVDAAPNELVAVRRKDLRGERAIKAALYDNRSGETSEWDTDVLAEIAQRDGDLIGRLFEGERDVLAAIAPKSEVEDVEPQIDRAEELREKFQVVSGQLWQLGEHRLLCGDSTRREDVERAMEKDKARLMFTDPPYGVSYADKNIFLNAIGRPNSVEKAIESDHQTPDEMSKFWRAAFGCVRDFLAPGAVYYVTGPQGGDLLLLLLALRDCGFQLRHMIIWAKNQFVIGRSDYHYQHEPVIYGWVNGAGHKFYGNRGESSLWAIDKPRNSDNHPTTKPVELYERGIKNSTRPGDIVVEPFLGSGTGLIACEKLGRRCRAIEISPAYIAVTLQRYLDATGKMPVLIDAINNNGKQKAKPKARPNKRAK